MKKNSIGVLILGIGILFFISVLGYIGYTEFKGEDNQNPVIPFEGCVANWIDININNHHITSINSKSNIKIGTSLNEEKYKVEGIFYEKNTRDIGFVDYDKLNYPSNLININKKILTVNKDKENEFFKRKGFYLANKLNTEIRTEGTISGDISGNIPIEKSSGGLIFIYDYTSKEPINLRLEGDISLLSKIEVPTKEVEEEEFYKLNKEYGKLVRCMEIENNEYWVNGNRPYALFCAFDMDGLQFLTSIKSIMEERDGCYSKIDKDVYMEIDGSLYITPTITFNVDSNCNIQYPEIEFRCKW